MSSPAEHFACLIIGNDIEILRFCGVLPDDPKAVRDLVSAT